MSKRSKQINIKINLTNRWLYTLIAIGILAIIGVGVYAFASPITGVGHSIEEIQSCGEGKILKVSGGIWTCVDMPSGASDTRCDTSGTCSQICIGAECKTSWPVAALVKGVAVYSRHTSCTSSGFATFLSTCITRQCAYAWQSQQYKYYLCDGTCGAWTSSTVSTISCPNTLKGYLIN